MPQPSRPDPRFDPRLGAMAARAAYAGGALTAAGALGLGLLYGQALLARLTIPGAEAPPPRCGGLYGAETGSGVAVRLAVLGDSTAAGYGVHTRADTPGALLASWIAEASGRPVRLTCPAVVGSVSAWLPAQVETVLEAGVVDLAVIFIGANDVTTRAGDAVAVRHLAEAVVALRSTGAEVVVATCPDMGTIRAIKPPLRWAARRWSRQLAAAQSVAAAGAGARVVPLGELIRPRFDLEPEVMFGTDRYHPSAEGYRLAASVVLPAVLAALALDQAQPPVAVPAEVPAGVTAQVPPERPAKVPAARTAADARNEKPLAEAVFAASARWAEWVRRRVSRSVLRPTGAVAAETTGFAVPSLSGVSPAASAVE
jgi:lysophospholipase L1-like esterase